MPVQLDFAVPPSDLAEYITLFYHFRVDDPHFSDTERADHAQLRFRLSGSNNRYVFADGNEQVVGPIHLVGPTTGPTAGSADGPAELVGFGLTPVGWAALIQSDASAMVNRAIDCGDMFEGCAETAAALHDAPDTSAKIAILEAFVRRAIVATGSSTIAFARHVDTWLAGATSPELQVLEAATGLSRRQVERRCNALYGAPPKMLARKYRALRAAVALVTDGAESDDLLMHGFYDQSHLIREVKQFTGCTPRQLRANPSLLAHMTMTQRTALEGQITPLVSAT